MSRELDMLDECLRLARTFDLRLSVHRAPLGQPQPTTPTRRRRRRPAAAADLRMAMASMPTDPIASARPSVESIVLDLVSHVFQVRPEHVHLESRLGGWCVCERGPDLGENELDRIQLVIELQERFERTLKDPTIDQWRTVADIIHALEAAA